jgi:hypothetical protein
MKHSLGIRIAEICLTNRSTLPLLAVGILVLLTKEMFGAIEQSVRQRIVLASCVSICEQY